MSIKNPRRTGDLAQHLRVLVALKEDPDTIPITCVLLQLSVTPVPVYTTPQSSDLPGNQAHP